MLMHDTGWALLFYDTDVFSILSAIACIVAPAAISIRVLKGSGHFDLFLRFAICTSPPLRNHLFHAKCLVDSILRTAIEDNIEASYEFRWNGAEICCRRDRQ